MDLDLSCTQNVNSFLNKVRALPQIQVKVSDLPSYCNSFVQLDFKKPLTQLPTASSCRNWLLVTWMGVFLAG